MCFSYVWFKICPVAVSMINCNVVLLTAWERWYSNTFKSVVFLNSAYKGGCVTWHWPLHCSTEVYTYQCLNLLWKITRKKYFYMRVLWGSKNSVKWVCLKIYSHWQKKSSFQTVHFLPLCPCCKFENYVNLNNICRHFYNFLKI